MQEGYSIFKKYPTLEQAAELKALLDKEGIESVLGNNIPPVDVTFSGSTLQHEFEVRIKPSDFDKAEDLLEQQAENLIDQVDKHYYLFDFTDEELYEILLKSDEWNEFDYSLAQKILFQRGTPIDKALLNSLKNERLKQLAQPEENQRAWIILGYIFAFLGGLLGIVIGYFLWTAKKTLPNGEKVYSYSEKDRKQGKYIFIIAIIVLPIALILRAISYI